LNGPRLWLTIRKHFLNDLRALGVNSRLIARQPERDA
jgi:hypothetical protein